MEENVRESVFSAGEVAKWLVTMAVADGMLSPNEVAYVRNFS